MEEPKLPKFDYYLDESDPDVVELCAARTAPSSRLSAPGGHQGGHRGGRQRGLPSSPVASACGREEREAEEYRQQWEREDRLRGEEKEVANRQEAYKSFRQ